MFNGNEKEMYFKHVYPGGLVEYLTLKRSSVISGAIFENILSH